MVSPAQPSQVHPPYARCWFVIYFLSRCGSSHLVSLLNSHKNIECYQEEFAADPQNHTKRASHRTPDKTLQRVHDIFVEHPSYSHAAGFKFKYPSQCALYPEIQEYLMEHKNHMRVIQLTRKNYLKMYVSHMNAKKLYTQEKVWNTARPLSATPLHIDIEACKQCMEIYENNTKHLNAATQLFPNRLCITYEDLLEHPTEILHTVLTFLGVSTDKKLTSEIHKHTTDDLSQAVSNWAEVQEALYDTRWQEFLPECAPLQLST